MDLAVGILGVIVGIIASIIIGRYYYLRTVNKRLSIFSLMQSEVFAGIAPDVRQQLHFHFNEREVTQLQQVLFLVANTGERAIRDLIEPLRLDLPPTAVILDASIVHREPPELAASLHLAKSEGSEATNVHLGFPLLNSKEFFVVKMLLSGQLASGNLTFHVLCDDLPRTIRSTYLPPTAYDDKPYWLDWGLAAVALAVLAIPAWLCYVIYMLREARPHLFPFPWSTFVYSWESALVVVPAVLVIAVLTLFGLFMFAASLFKGQFPPPKGPRFPLPKAVRDAVFPFPMWRFHPEFGETPVRRVEAANALGNVASGGVEHG